MFKMYNSDDFESKKVAVTYNKRGEFKEKTEVVVINQLGAFQSVIATSLKNAITMFCLFHHTNMLDIIPCHHQEDQLIIASLFSLYPTMTSYHAIIMENKPL